jgi:hypothetical protein
MPSTCIQEGSHISGTGWWQITQQCNIEHVAVLFAQRKHHSNCTASGSVCPNSSMQRVTASSAARSPLAAPLLQPSCCCMGSGCQCHFLPAAVAPPVALALCWAGPVGGRWPAGTYRLRRVSARTCTGVLWQQSLWCTLRVFKIVELATIPLAERQIGLWNMTARLVLLW